MEARGSRIRACLWLLTGRSLSHDLAHPLNTTRGGGVPRFISRLGEPAPGWLVLNLTLIGSTVLSV
eukprot:SAG31_NODE_2220_length_6157_cov_4.078244_6_plen_66_part_00